MKTQKLAAIDIGSNSLKLVIVEAAASDSFTVLLQDRERVRLGHETLKNRFLSEEAINLSAAAIAKFRSIADSREVDSIIAVATASVREADNAAEFVDEIEKRTGVRIEVLSSLEEARLIGVAVAQFYGADQNVAFEYRHRRRFNRTFADEKRCAGQTFFDETRRGRFNRKIYFQRSAESQRNQKFAG